MHVLVLGAGGYIGRRLSFFLAENGFNVTAFCREATLDEEWSLKMEQIIIGDISEPEVINNLSEIDFDAIINLISLNHINSEISVNNTAKVNLLPGWNILERFSKKSLKCYIYFSTVQVYGNNLKGIIAESTGKKPHNFYGLSHLLSEEVTNYFSSKRNISGFNIRLSNGYGEPRNFQAKCWDLVINNLCFNAHFHKKIILKSDGSSMRDFINLIDVLEGIKELLLNVNRSSSLICDTINFASGKTISMLNAAHIVKEAYKKRNDVDIPIFINGDEIAKTHGTGLSPEYTLDNFKFRSLMNDKKQCTLIEGITQLLEYLDKQ